MDRASIIAIEEVCKRCHLYTKHCGMLECPSQCVHSGHFIDGYRKAEEDLWGRIEKYLSEQDPRNYATAGFILKNFDYFKKQIMEEE